MWETIENMCGLAGQLLHLVAKCRQSGCGLRLSPVAWPPCSESCVSCLLSC
jgi:hypothetical protein